MDQIIIIDKDRLKLPPGAKVIKASSYTDIHNAEATLAQAQKMADQIVTDAQARADGIINAAESVYATEKKRGYQEGLQAAKEDMATQINTLTLKAGHFFHSVEAAVVTLVLDTVKKVIGTIEQPVLVNSLVKKALSVFKNQQQIILKVSPVEMDLLNEQLSEILTHYPHINTIEVVGDKRLARGEVILESQIGIVNASIDTQLAAIKQAFSNTFKKQ